MFMLIYSSMSIVYTHKRILNNSTYSCFYLSERELIEKNDSENCLIKDTVYIYIVKYLSRRKRDEILNKKDVSLAIFDRSLMCIGIHWTWCFTIRMWTYMHDILSVWV